MNTPPTFPDGPPNWFDKCERVVRVLLMLHTPCLFTICGAYVFFGSMLLGLAGYVRQAEYGLVAVITYVVVAAVYTTLTKRDHLMPPDRKNAAARAAEYIKLMPSSDASIYTVLRALKDKPIHNEAGLREAVRILKFPTHTP